MTSESPPRPMSIEATHNGTIPAPAPELIHPAWARITHWINFVAGIVIVLSGLSIWKPVQVQELTALFGGYDAARYVHFFAMAAIAGFLVIHVIMALLVPRSLRAMIAGR